MLHACMHQILGVLTDRPEVKCSSTYLPPITTWQKPVENARSKPQPIQPLLKCFVFVIGVRNKNTKALPVHICVREPTVYGKETSSAAKAACVTLNFSPHATLETSWWVFTSEVTMITIAAASTVVQSQPRSLKAYYRTRSAYSNPERWWCFSSTHP